MDTDEGVTGQTGIKNRRRESGAVESIEKE